jgi:hypothetical protein
MMCAIILLNDRESKYWKVRCIAGPRAAFIVTPQEEQMTRIDGRRSILA